LRGGKVVDNAAAVLTHDAAGNAAPETAKGMEEFQRQQGKEFEKNDNQGLHDIVFVRVSADCNGKRKQAKARMTRPSENPSGCRPPPNLLPSALH